MVYSPEELITTIPQLFVSLRNLESRNPSEFISTIDVAGLEPSNDPRLPWKELSGNITLEFTLSQTPDESFEKKLRSAITDQLGRPHGSAKQWDAGYYQISINYRDKYNKLVIHLHQEYSLRELRDAATDFLNGKNIENWLLEQGFDSKQKLARAFVNRKATHVSVSFFMPAAARPIHTSPKDDDENLEQTLAYLEEQLGESDNMGTWKQGKRSFQFQRMRSRARTIHFSEQL